MPKTSRNTSNRHKSGAMNLPRPKFRQGRSGWSVGAAADRLACHHRWRLSHPLLVQAAAASDESKNHPFCAAQLQKHCLSNDCLAQKLMLTRAARCTSEGCPPKRVCDPQRHQYPVPCNEAAAISGTHATLRFSLHRYVFETVFRRAQLIQQKRLHMNPQLYMNPRHCTSMCRPGSAPEVGAISCRQMLTRAVGSPNST